MTSPVAARSEPLYMDPATSDVFVLGERVHLTGMQRALLQLLNGRRGATVTYRQIYESVWRSEDYDPDRDKNNVQNLVAQLRARLERDPKKPSLIRTLGGVGYRLE